MNCVVCYRPFCDEVPSITLNCSCIQCVDCLSSWILTQTKELEFQRKESISCMNTECKYIFKVQDILNDFPQPYQEKINQALFEVYLRKSKDIRRCPRPECNYAGIINLSAKCQDKLQCVECGEEWRDKIHYSVSERVFESLYKMSPTEEEISCILWEEVFTKKCPKCDANIEKNGGCSHMTCKSCGYEYCWYCSQNNDTHENSLCWVNVSIRFGLVLLILIHIFCLAELYQYIIGFSMIVMNVMLEICFLDFFIYLLCIFSPFNIVGKVYSSEIHIRTIISGIILTFFFLLIYLLGSFYSLLRIFILQFGVIGFGFIYVDIFGRWTNSVY